LAVTDEPAKRMQKTKPAGVSANPEQGTTVGTAPIAQCSVQSAVTPLHYKGGVAARLIRKSLQDFFRYLCARVAAT
jgi:hypothetical protein